MRKVAPPCVRGHLASVVPFPSSHEAARGSLAMLDAAISRLRETLEAYPRRSTKEDLRVSLGDVIAAEAVVVSRFVDSASRSGDSLMHPIMALRHMMSSADEMSGLVNAAHCALAISAPSADVIDLNAVRIAMKVRERRRR